MYLTISDDKCFSSVLVIENISGCTADTNRHCCGLDLEFLIVLELLRYLEEECTLCEFQFELLVLLFKFRTAVILERDDLGIIKTYRGKSVASRIQGVSALESDIIDDRFGVSLGIFDIDRALDAEKTHRRGNISFISEKEHTADDYCCDNDGSNHTYGNDLLLFSKPFDFIDH